MYCAFHVIKMAATLVGITVFAFITLAAVTLAQCQSVGKRYHTCDFIPASNARSNAAKGAASPTAAASPDSTFRLTKKPAIIIDRQGLGISSVQFSPDGTHLACADTWTQFWLCDTRSGRRVWCQELPLTGAKAPSEFHSIAFARNGKDVVIASELHGPSICDASTGVVRHRLQVPTDLDDAYIYAGAVAVRCIGGTEVAVVRSGNDIVFWNPCDGKVIDSMKGLGRKVVFLNVTNNGKMLVTSQYDGNVFVRAIPSGRELLNIRLDVPGAAISTIVVTTIAITNGGKLLLGHGERIDCWDVAQKKRSWSAPCRDLGGDAVAISPDEKWFVTGLIDRQQIAVCNVCTGRVLTCPCRSSDTLCSVMALAFASDGNKIVTGMSNGTIAVWSIQSSDQKQ